MGKFSSICDRVVHPRHDNGGELFTVFILIILLLTVIHINPQGAKQLCSRQHPKIDFANFFFRK